MRHQRHQPPEELHAVAHQGFDFDGLLHDVGSRLDFGFEVRLFLSEFLDFDALDALHDEAQGAVGGLKHPVDDGRGARPVDVVGARFRDVGILGGHQPYHLVADDGVIHQLDGAGLPHAQREHREGIGHHLPQREDGHFLRYHGAGFIGFSFNLHRALSLLDLHRVLVVLLFFFTFAVFPP